MKKDNIIEIVEVKDWEFKIRSLTNRRKWYTIIVKNIKGFFCPCRSYKYQTNECKHIKILKKVIP